MRTATKISDPETRDGPIAKFYPVSEKVLKMPELKRHAKLVFAVLCRQAGDSDRAHVTISFLADRLKMDWQTVRRALSLLQRVGLIQFEIIWNRRPGRSRRSGRCYQLKPEYREGAAKSLLIPNSVLEFNDLSAGDKLVLSLLSHRQGEAEHECRGPTQSKIAEALGMPESAVELRIARLKRRGLLQAKQGRDHINRYRVTLEGGPARRSQ